MLSDSSEAEFHKYFVTHQAQGMKKKMISPIRRRAGPGESFFCNNAGESKHQWVKARKGQMYGERKLAWTEVVELLKSISKEEERNCEWAIVDKGPCKISHTVQSFMFLSMRTSVSHTPKRKRSTRKFMNFRVREHKLARWALFALRANVVINITTK